MAIFFMHNSRYFVNLRQMNDFLKSHSNMYIYVLYWALSIWALSIGTSLFCAFWFVAQFWGIFSAYFHLNLFSKHSTDLDWRLRRYHYNSLPQLKLVFEPFLICFSKSTTYQNVSKICTENICRIGPRARAQYLHSFFVIK